jgi:hypothetical protein
VTFRSFPLSSHFSGFVLPLEALLELLLVRDLDLLLREDALLELLDRFPFFFFFLDFLSFFRDFFDFFDLSFFFSDREVKASCCNWATAASKAFNSALLGAAFPPPGNPSAATPWFPPACPTAAPPGSKACCATTMATNAPAVPAVLTVKEAGLSTM